MSVQEYYDKFFKQEGEGICKICGKPTKYNGINKGYGEYCSVECRHKAPKIKQEYTEIKCEICDMVISGNSIQAASTALMSHLKKEHNIYNAKIYYDTYIKKDDEGICLACKKETTFRGVTVGYDKYCSIACQQEYQRQQNTSYTSRIGAIMGVRNMVKKMAESIKEKYSNFLKTDPRKSYGDVRTDPITHKTVKSTKQVVAIDGTPTELKTEISSSTQQDPYLGTQRMYRPKQESCTYDTAVDEIMDGENHINETEWC